MRGKTYSGESWEPTIMSAVNLFVHSPDTRSERRFELHTTIGKLKVKLRGWKQTLYVDDLICSPWVQSKLELITGVPVANQEISIYDDESSEKPSSVLSDDTKVLGYYSPRDYQLMKVRWLPCNHQTLNALDKVVDLNPSISLTGQLSDVSQVEKFELSSEAYAQRQGERKLWFCWSSCRSLLISDSVLAYKQRNKVGRFAPKSDDLPSTQVAHVDISIGSRCEVESTAEGLSKRGVVRFVGETNFASGVWVGIEYDEPFGKNDGS